ncbi:hypothetical protein [Cohnella cellulosilytica]|uniref:hypothetical protein n=1 Tax=Cohnella cellulosilytica TaxID=986710 RepID=UPI00361187D8
MLRLERFKLSVAKEKMKIMAFGSYAEKSKKNGGGKPKTFGFPGFTHYCSKSEKVNSR